MKIPFLNNLSQEKLHHVFLVLGLVFLTASVLGYAAFRAGYTFEISQFFASGGGPEIVLNGGAGPYSHNDRVSVSWSRGDAVSCASSNGWINTGGSIEGTDESGAIDACASSGSEVISIQCTFADGSTAQTNAPFSVDTASCPGETTTETETETTTETTSSPVCLDLTSDKGGRVIINSKTGGGACITASPGSSHTNSSNLTNTYDFPVGHVTRVYHDLRASCDWSYGNEEGGTKDIHGWTEIASGQTQGFSETLVAQCGRYQIDFNVYNVDSTACPADPRSDQFEYHSSMLINTGIDCGVTTTSEPTPTATVIAVPVPPVCAPLSQTVSVGASAVISASGGNGVFAWSAPAGTPSSAAGSSLSVSYTAPGTHAVTLSSGGNQTTCSVTVTAVASPTPSPTPTPSITVTPSPTPTPSITPTPTPISTAPALSIVKVVRLVNQNGLEVDSVAAQPGETVEFVIRVSSNGAGTAFGVIARDLLPAGLVYQVGSTRIDDIATGDGILTGGLPLGDMLSGRVITIRFRATLAPAGTFAPGTTMLTNVALARASNVTEVSDPAFVSVTQIPSGPLTLELTKLGRNQSRQEVAFHSPVAGAASEVITFSIRVRNPGSAPVTNIVVRDIVPQVITPVPQTVTLNGTSVPDQALTTGVVVGTLAPGQEAFIIFSGRVAPAAQLPQGLMTVINTATLTATNIPTLTAQLPINITNYIGPVAQVPTGPGDSALLALIVSITLTLVYVGYLGTDVHRRKEASRVAKESRDQIDFRQ